MVPRPPQQPGVVTLPSARPAPEVLDRLSALAAARGLTIFARIDFAREAAAVGREARPMAQLVFGGPRGGSPVLAAAPLAGLDLPPRALAWTDAEGHTWLSYADPAALQAKHGLTATQVAGLHEVHELCQAAVGE